LIEGDIKGFFDNIDHKIMMKLITDRLNPDRTIIGLLNKIFKAGYLENNTLKHSILGVPQGGIISPILSNLYLTPFDEFIDSLKLKYLKEPISKPNPVYKKLEKQISNLKDKLTR